jgi:hypothetical protein
MQFDISTFLIANNERAAIFPPEFSIEGDSIKIFVPPVD